MTTTFMAVKSRLFAIIEAVAAAGARIKTQQTDPSEVDLAKGEAVIALLDGDAPPRPEPEVNPGPPYYMLAEPQVVIVAADAAATLDARVDAILTDLDAALHADPSLGGSIKGMLWSLDASEVIDLPGSANERIAVVTVSIEYESLRRLG